MAEIKEDDPCGVCGKWRSHHGDMHHEFNMDGNLIPIKPGPPPKKDPPKTREEAEAITQAGVELAKRVEANTIMRLIEVLVDKNLLEPKELIYVLGGHQSASPQ